MRTCCFIDYFKFPQVFVVHGYSFSCDLRLRNSERPFFSPSQVRVSHGARRSAAGMDINTDSDEEQSPSASTEKENATRLARQCGSPGCDLKDFHLGPCKSQHGSRPSGKASAAHWPSGTAAWVSRKSLFFPVVTGGYRDNPAPNKPGLVRVRYVSVKDKHRTIEDVPPSRLRAWDDVHARAAASVQTPSKNCDASLVAIVQRVADGEDADAVLRATRQQQQQRPLAAEPPPRQRQKQPRQPPP